jgi:hypothetical protein
MRWHPVLIRFALEVYLTSQSTYKRLRGANIVALPSERHLSRFANFCTSKPGFHREIVHDMIDKLQDGRPFIPPPELRGGFAFDEMHIKDGLVWDRTTGSLLGWTQTDLHAEAEELGALLDDPDEIPMGKAQDMMAQSVLQVGALDLPMPADGI